MTARSLMGYIIIYIERSVTNNERLRLYVFVIPNRIRFAEGAEIFPACVH